MRRERIERLLPVAYQQATSPGGVLGAVLDVMEALHAPDERIAGDLGAWFDPDRTHERFLPFLLEWVGLEYLRAPGRTGLLLPAGRVRALLVEAAALAQERGTPQGLTRFLQIATGVAGFTVEVTPSRPFHMVVCVPEQARDQVEVVGFLVEQEKPAATTFELSSEETKP